MTLTPAWPGLAYPGMTYPGDTSGSTLASVGSYTFRVITAGQQYPIPDFRGMQIGYEYSDVSGCKFAYVKNGINRDNIADGSVLVAYRDGVEGYNSRWLLFAGEGDDDPADPTERWIGRNLFDVFRKVVVQPAGSATEVTFTTATPGGILDALFDAAQLRGAMTGITWTFTSTVDSAGAAWDSAKLLNLKYKAGIKYLDIVRDLVDKGIIECRFNGTEFQVYKEGTMGQTTSVELVAGQDVEELPYKWTSEDRAKFSMIIGDEGVIVKKTDGAVPTGPFGIEEQAVTQGGTTDVGTLTLINDYYLSRNNITREQLTRKVLVRPGRPIPNINYRVGDWIRERTVKNVAGSLRTESKLNRVRSIVIDVEDNGGFQNANLVLNDKILEADIRNARRIDGITGGVSGSGGTPAAPPGTADATTPNPPTGLLLATDTYVDSNGINRAILSANWTAPTQNTDLSTLTDLKEYEVQWKKASAVLWRSDVANESAWVTSDLDIAVSYNVRVRTWDNSGHFSAWTATGTLSTATDTVPPAVASTPSLTVARGTVIVAWDGLTAAAGAMDPDFSHVEIHRSPINAFTPSSATKSGELFARGTHVVTGQLYGETWYYKFVSVDTNGNASGASAQASCVTSPLVGGDLANNIIAAGHMMANSVETDNLAAGAVTTEKISLGVLRTNLVGDSSFEDNYTMGAWDLYGAGGPGNPSQWRTQSGAPFRSVGQGRSGAMGLRLDADATAVSAPVEASVLSNAFQVTAGKTYKLVIYATALTNIGRLSIQVFSGGSPGGVEVFSPPPTTGMGEWFGTDVPVAAGATITPDDFQPYAVEIAADTTQWLAIRIMNYQPPAYSRMVVDDISVVEMGIGGATEITAAGFRLFGDDGSEIGAFVSNRPNYFSVSSNGDTVASIDKTGAAVFADLSVSADDAFIGGLPILGVQGRSEYDWVISDNPGRDYVVNPIGSVERRSLGVVAQGGASGGSFPGTITSTGELGLFQVDADMEPGRMYRVSVSPFLTIAAIAGGTVGLRLRYTTDGTTPNLTSPVLMYNYHCAATAGQYVGLECAPTPVFGSNTRQDLKILVCVYASGTTATIYSGSDIYVTVEDAGPTKAASATIRNLTSGTPAASAKTYTSTWNPSAYASWGLNGGGTYVNRGSGTLYHGYYSSNQGDQFSQLVFGIGSTLTGATIKKVELYLKNAHTYYADYANIKIRADSGTTVGNTPITAGQVKTFSWKKGYGLWVDITSVITGAGGPGTGVKRIQIGKADTTSARYYGYFLGNVSGRPALRITYVK